MFDLSPEKILIIGILALIVLGPDRLPSYARRAGQVLAQVKQMSGGLQQEMRSALAEPRQVLDDARQELGLGSVPRVPNVRRAVLDTLTGGAVETTSRAPSSSADPAGTEPSGGFPPPPDDPSLN